MKNIGLESQEKKTYTRKINEYPFFSFRSFWECVTEMKYRFDEEKMEEEMASTFWTITNGMADKIRYCISEICGELLYDCWCHAVYNRRRTISVLDVAYLLRHNTGSNYNRLLELVSMEIPADLVRCPKHCPFPENEENERMEKNPFDSVLQRDFMEQLLEIKEKGSYQISTQVFKALLKHQIAKEHGADLWYKNTTECQNKLAAFRFGNQVYLRGKKQQDNKKETKLYTEAGALKDVLQCVVLQCVWNLIRKVHACKVDPENADLSEETCLDRVLQTDFNYDMEDIVQQNIQVTEINKKKNKNNENNTHKKTH